MKPRKALCLLLALVHLLSGAALMEVDLTTPAPTQAPAAAPELSAAPLLDAPPIALSCAAAILVEPESGQVLFEQNADVARPVASVTKVMTILLALEALDEGRVLWRMNSSFPKRRPAWAARRCSWTWERCSHFPYCSKHNRRQRQRCVRGQCRSALRL